MLGLMECQQQEQQEQRFTEAPLWLAPSVAKNSIGPMRHVAGGTTSTIAMQQTQGQRGPMAAKQRRVSMQVLASCHVLVDRCWLVPRLQSGRRAVPHHAVRHAARFVIPKAARVGALWREAGIAHPCQ
jgi:hypothetical protein